MSTRLLLDLGNTRLKWALAPAGDAESGFDLGPVHARAYGEGDFLSWLRTGLSVLPGIDAVHWVAVTSEDRVQQVLACVRDSLRGPPPTFRRARTTAQAPLGPGRRLVCAYPTPDHLGADRWLSLRGALGESTPPLLVVNAGTALTLDAVDAGDRHLGGLILAGIEGMQAGLLARAPHLSAEPGCPGRDAFWAQDTAPAVGRAPWQAAAGLIERALSHLRRSGAPAPSLVLAGGDAEALAGLLEHPARIEPHLVLKGLLRAAQDP